MAPILFSWLGFKDMMSVNMPRAFTSLLYCVGSLIVRHTFSHIYGTRFNCFSFFTFIQIICKYVTLIRYRSQLKELMMTVSQSDTDLEIFANRYIKYSM